IQSEIAYQWSWRENNGSYVPFDPDQNYQIEMAYIKQNHHGKIVVVGDLNKTKNGHSYEIDFDNMTEINTHFRQNPRPIRREPKIISADVIWELNLGRQWMKFDSETCKHIEMYYKSGSV